MKLGMERTLFLLDLLQCITLTQLSTDISLSVQPLVWAPFGSVLGAKAEQLGSSF